MRWLLALALLGGCRPAGGGLKTPAGYSSYNLDNAGILGVHTQDEILLALDQRIAEWVDQRGPDYGVDYCRGVARSYFYDFVDHWRFPTGASPTGYAAGEIFYDERRIKASMWSQGVSPTLPIGTPEWTIIFNPATGNYNYGVTPLLPVIGHELDHAIGIDHP